MNKEFFPFYAWLLPILNAKEALFMSLLLNKCCESNKMVKRMDWFTITADEIHLHTGLSKTQQVAIKKCLYKIGFLETERRGRPPKNWYKINAEKLKIYFQEPFHE